MPKVILKSNYIKGGGKYGSNLVNYIGTRDGVEKHVQKYVDYIANREGVEKFSNHGLFTSGNDKIILSKVQEEVSNHKGNIWLPIISITREDAIKTGFDNGTAWKNMLSQIAPKIAEYYKIKIDNLQWYASYHDEGYHPHVHMLVYSQNSNEGFLTSQGIEKFKALVTKEVFSLELKQVYAIQTMQRDEVKQKCSEIFQDIKIEPSQEIFQLIFDLNQALEQHKGKKSYGYLQKSDKEKVDKIVDKLEKLPAIQQAYDLWYQTKFEIYKNYTNELPKKLPLSEQKTFHSIKNIVIQEVGKIEFVKEQNFDIDLVTLGIETVFSGLEMMFTDKIIQDCTTRHHQIDSKALARILEKRQAMGQKVNVRDLIMSM